MTNSMEDDQRYVPIGSKKTKTISFLSSTEMADQLLAVSIATGRSKSDVIREAIALSLPELMKGTGESLKSAVDVINNLRNSAGVK